MGRPREIFTSDKFFSKLKEGPNGCLEWTGKRNRPGYGKVFVGRGPSGKDHEVLAHRLAMKFSIGMFHEELCVLHKCDNPCCCNPKHLFFGTRTDNADDRDAKGRQAQGGRHRSVTRPESVFRGEGHPNSRVTASQAREITVRYGAGESPSALGREFGVGYKAIWQIATGRRHAA